MAKRELFYDAEGDFQDVQNYQQLFEELLEASELDGRVVVEEVLEEELDDPVAFTVEVTAAGKTMKYRSKAPAEEWADTAFVQHVAEELGKTFGFRVKPIETGDQCVRLRIVR